MLYSAKQVIIQTFITLNNIWGKTTTLVLLPPPKNQT